MDFYNYRIDLNQDAGEAKIVTEDDWYEPQWFDVADLNDAKLGEPTRNTLIANGIISD